MAEAVPGGALQELGPHVTAYAAGAYPLVNAAIVRGSDATLVFDTAVLHFGRQLKAAVAATGRPASHVVLSHVHYDHAHGAMYFAPPAKVWSRRFTRDRLAHWSTRDLGPFAEDLKSTNPSLAQAYGDVRIVVPDEVVERETEIDLGRGVRVRLFPEGTAHSPGDLWAMVEPDGIVLCGDLWFNGFEPYLGTGTVAGMLAALRHMRSAGARLYLPGHGPAGLIGPENDDMAARYCAWIDDHTAAGIARGWRGETLRTAVRAEYAEQRDRTGGVRFANEIAGFLEEGVETAEKEQLAAIL
jgi:glyoxylase-like metal-dependent hydrolase (beta-lactamase superfamily II)